MRHVLNWMVAAKRMGVRRRAPSFIREGELPMKVKLRMFSVLLVVFMLCFGICAFADEKPPLGTSQTFTSDYIGLNEKYFGNQQTYVVSGSGDVSAILCIQESKKDNATTGLLYFYSKNTFVSSEHYYAGVVRPLEYSSKYKDSGYYVICGSYDVNALTNPYAIYYYPGEGCDIGTILEKVDNGTLDKDPNYVPAPVNPNDFNEDEAEKDINLGYLKDVEFKTTSYQNSNSDSRIEVTGRRFTWNKSQSSTGYPLSDNVFVQIYADLYFDKKSFGGDEVKSSIGKGDFDKYGDYVASDGLFEIKFVEWQHDSDNPLYEQYQFIQENKGVSLSGSYRIDLKVRLIKKDSSGWKYGGWLTISDKNGDYHTEDEEGNDTDIPDDGHVDVDDDGNETETISDNVDLVWFLKQLTNLKDALGEFPALISSVFGFLPPQLLTLIGVGIAAIIIIALVKAVL